MDDAEQIVKFLTEARRRLGASRHIEEARLLKMAIRGLEKSFTGVAASDDECEAFISIFFGGPINTSSQRPWG